MCRTTHKWLAAALAGLFVALLGGCASTPEPVQDKPTAFWPAYPDEPHIQYLTSFTGSADLEPPKTKMQDLIYGKENEAELGIKKPYGLAMWNGRIYVCDLRSACVTILNIRTRQTLIMGASGSGALQSPTDIAVAPDGMKYVADLGQNLVIVFDPADRMVGRIGMKDFKPVSVAVHQNELYTADFVSQQIIVFDRTTGREIRRIGEKGSGPGQFVRPLGLDVDAQGNVYVADVLKCEVQQFDPQGKFVRVFGTRSANAGGLVRPKHIAVDKEGIIYIVDAAFQNVQLFNNLGQLYTFFGSAGSHPGAMYLPAGVCVDDDPSDLELFRQFIHPAFQAERLILVSNQFGVNRVSVYAFGRLKPGKTVADIQASKGLVPEGTGAVPTTGPLGPLPTTSPAPDDAPTTAPSIATPSVSSASPAKSTLELNTGAAGGE